jgi:serine/threonine protein kinase
MPFVASGSFGCIFQPAVKCTNSTRNKQLPGNAVSKIFADDEDFKSEKNLQKIVKYIDPNNTFTRPLYVTCNVDNFSNVSSSLHNCEHIDLNIKKDYSQIVYKDGGNDLIDFLSDYRGNIYKFKKILTDFECIVKGLGMLSSHNFVHLDLKPDNILYTMETGKAFLIDFGLMKESQNVFKKKYIISFDYPFYPPEFKMHLYQDNFEKFVERFLENFGYKYDINGEKHNVYAAITKYIGYTKIEQKRDLLDLQKIDDVTRFTDKIDIYSLGIVFVILYIWSGYHKIEKPTSLDAKIKSLIISMIRFNPAKRISNDELVKKYHALLKHF